MNNTMGFISVFLFLLYCVHFCLSFHVIDYEEESKKIFAEMKIENPTSNEKKFARDLINERARVKDEQEEKNKYKDEADNAKKQVGAIEKEKNTTADHAAKLEFLLLYLNKFGYIEENYCPTWMPFDDDKYYERIRSEKGFHYFRRDDLLWQKHSKKWLWILLYGDGNKCKQIDTLRDMLKHDVWRYIWFANQAQKMFSLLSDDNHLEGRVLDVNYLKKDQVSKYIDFLNPDMREAATIFFASEGWLSPQTN